MVVMFWREWCCIQLHALYFHLFRPTCVGSLGPTVMFGAGCPTNRAYTLLLVDKFDFLQVIWSWVWPLSVSQL